MLANWVAGKQGNISEAAQSSEITAAPTIRHVSGGDDDDDDSYQRVPALTPPLSLSDEATDVREAETRLPSSQLCPFQIP